MASTKKRFYITTPIYYPSGLYAMFLRAINE